MADEVKTAETVIDINSMPLADEAEISYDDASDAFAQPSPPPEAGNPYLASLEMGQKGLKEKRELQKDDFGNMVPTGKRVHFNLSTVAKIIRPDDPVVDRKLVFDNITTAAYNGTCRAAGVFHEVTGEAPPKGDFTLIQALVNRLAGKPQVRIYVGWEGYCNPEQGGCGRRVKGERSWPVVDGKRQTEVTCSNPKCRAPITAQAKIIRYARV